jgi:4-amino-4-deoxy-L-arabinose transferase-like glycosyltransferase
MFAQNIAGRSARIVQHATRREHLAVVALLALVVLITMYRLGAGSLWDQDEALYTEMAREMTETGDWLTPGVDGAPFYNHPPLYMWLVAATGKAVGFSTLTARFWSAAASVGTVFVTVLIGTRLFGPRAGLLAGAVLSVTLQFLVQAHLAVFDTVLLLWMLLAVHAFLRSYQERHRADYLRFFLFCGLGTLTKGPIGLLLPALVIVPFVVIRGAWRRWREVPWAWGIAIYLIVGSSWYAVETWRHGGRFLDSVFGYYALHRYVGVIDAQTGAWYFYLPVLFLGALPWTAFWPTAAAYHARRLHHDGSLFVVLWCVLTVLFYTSAGTKAPNYILPVYPLAAVGIAAIWDAAITDGRGAGLRLPLAVLIALLGALVAGAARYLAGLYPGASVTFAQLGYYQMLGRAVVIPAAALGIGLAAAFILLLARAVQPAFAALCAAMAVAWLGTLTSVVPVIETHQSLRPLALAINARLRPGDRVVGYGLYSASLIFYTDHHIEWTTRAADFRAAVCGAGRTFIIIGRQSLAEPGLLPAAVVPVAERRDVEVLLRPASARCVP